MFGRCERPVRAILVHIRPVHEPQHPAHLIVERLHVIFSALQALQIRVRKIITVVRIRCRRLQAIGPGAELHVQAIINCFISVVSAAPVAHHYAVEPPLFLKDIIQQVLIVAVPLALVQIVRAHDGPGAALLDGSLEGRQIYLVKGSVIDIHVCGESVRFLIVKGKMLYAGCDAIALNALDIRHHHTARKVWILAEIFKASAVQRGSVDIHSRTKQYVFFAVTCLLAYALPVEPGHLWIPCGRQGGQGWKCRAGIARPPSLLPLIPENFRTNAVRAVRHPHLRQAKPGNTCRTEFALSMQNCDFFF